jgi:hypothetical protein
MRKMGLLSGMVWIGMLLLASMVVAQELVTVPDVTGMSVPQAAALLNRSGIVLGSETNVGWTAESGLPQNTISAQSVAGGQSVARGTVVDITVLRSPNAYLLYDDNDLTLVNQTGGTLDLNGIAFNSVDGSGPATFTANRWGGILEGGDCGQIWSISRGEPKPQDGCASMQWLTTNDPAQHFWTGANGATRFNIVQTGVERAVCSVAAAGRCDFFLTGGGAGGDVVPYVYFAYLPDRMIISNQSPDQWMSLNQLNVYNQNFAEGTAPLKIADPTLYTNQGQQLIGRVDQLAPGQCLYWTNGSPQPDTPPQSCDVVARFNMAAELIFWSKDFSLDSVTDGQRHTCPAATPGRLTICVMPR